MRYVTHQFAHLETLERAKRWLIQAGIDASRIEARTQGILSLAVAVEPGESAEVKQIIDAAESSDPDGNPGIWDLASVQRHVYPQTSTAPASGIADTFGVVRGRLAAPGCRPRSDPDRHRASERLPRRERLNERPSVCSSEMLRAIAGTAQPGRSGRSSRQRMMNFDRRSAASIECS